jgi:hypothetical protein
LTSVCLAYGKETVEKQKKIDQLEEKIKNEKPI